MEELRPEDAFSFLLGEWRVEREVSGEARMEGWLTIREIGAGEAEYRERVSVTTAAGAVFAGSQRYVVRRLDDGFVLCFAEAGAVFEEVRFAAGGDGVLRAEARHLCGEDWYRSAFEVGPGRQFRIRHAVSGPRKQYVSETTFSAA